MSDERLVKHAFAWKDWILSAVYRLPIVLQIILWFTRHSHSGLEILTSARWALLAVSGFFGWVPFFTLRRKSWVPRRKSYVHTTVRVDSGIYAIVCKVDRRGG